MVGITPCRIDSTACASLIIVVHSAMILATWAKNISAASKFYFLFWALFFLYIIILLKTYLPYTDHYCFQDYRPEHRPCLLRKASASGASMILICANNSNTMNPHDTQYCYNEICVALCPPLSTFLCLTLWYFIIFYHILSFLWLFIIYSSVYNILFRVNKLINILCLPCLKLDSI